MTDWQPLASSNLDAMRYDPTRELLLVRFKGGAVYAYEGVPADIATGLAEADSPGRYMAENIKRVFAAVKQDPTDEEPSEEAAPEGEEADTAQEEEAAGALEEGG